MSARTISTTQLEAGYKSYGWYNGRNCAVIRQRIKPTQGSPFMPLNATLAGRGRILWAEVVTQTAVSVAATGDGTNTANSYAIAMFPTTGTAPLTAPPTTGTQSNPAGTNGYLVLQTPGLTTAATNQARGVPLIFGTVATSQCVNTNTVPALLGVLPAFTNSNRISYVGTGTANFRFGTDTTTTITTDTCGVIDVTLYVEEFEQAPYAN